MRSPTGRLRFVGSFVPTVPPGTRWTTPPCGLGDEVLNAASDLWEMGLNPTVPRVESRMR